MATGCTECSYSPDAILGNIDQRPDATLGTRSRQGLW
jgi:hypothetical protein